MKIQDFLRDQIFRSRLEAQDVLVVFDAHGRYRELVRGLHSETCAVVDATGSTIAARGEAHLGLARLGRGEVEKLMILVGTPPPRNDAERMQHPFAPFTLLGRPFPDGESETYGALCERAKPGLESAVRKLFADGRAPDFALVDALDGGGAGNGPAWPHLRAMFGGGSSARELLTALLLPDAADRARLDGDEGWVSEAHDFLHANLGWRPKTKSRKWAPLAEETWRFLLLSDFAFDVTPGAMPVALVNHPRAEVAARELVETFCEGARQSRRHQDAYVEHARRVEGELGLVAHPAAADADAGRRETFAFQERATLAGFIAACLRGDLDAAAGIAGAHQGSVWLKDAAAFQLWSVAGACRELLAELEAARATLGMVGPTLEALVRTYAADLRRLDTRQRELEQGLTEPFELEALDELVRRCREGYRQFTQGLTLEFQARVAAEGWPATGLPRNASTFERLVRPTLDRQERVAYFLIDSLRFELGAELTRQLGEAHACEIQAACAQLPTITPVGMASLLAGAESRLALLPTAPGGGELVAHLDGKPVVRPEDRLADLKSGLGDRVEMRTLDEVVRVKGKGLNLPATVKLLVVRSTEIDASAENDPGDALNKIPRTLKRLLAGIGRLRKEGFRQVVIATDHGFLLLPEPEPGSSTSVPPGDWRLRKDRCLLGQGSESAGARVFERGEVGIPGEGFTHYAAARGLATFVAGTAYFHSGLSLQECVVPTITVTLQPETAAPLARPEVVLTYKKGRTDRITTRRPLVEVAFKNADLFQAANPDAIEFTVEAHDAKGRVVGEAAPGPNVNPATNGVRLRAEETVSVTLRMDDDFEGPFTVKASQPEGGTFFATLPLRTDYVDR